MHRFIVSLAIFQGILILVHLAVYAALTAAFGGGSVWSETAFLALAFTFVVASVLTRYMNNQAINFFYAAAAYWFGLVHFLLMGAAGFLLISWTSSLVGAYPAPWLIGAVCFGAVFLVHLYGTRKSGHLEVTTIRPMLAGVPARWQGKRIVYTSDIHLGAIRGERFAARVVEKIQALQPEAVFIGGDLYDGPACDVRAIIAPLRALRPPLGTYFVTGNHEYYLPDPRDALTAVRETGIRVLNDEKADVGGITVVGVDYQSVHHRESFEEILAAIGVEHGAFSLLLKHEPTDLGIARDAGITFGLFGHTHAGQIFPLSLVTRRVYRGFDYGLQKLGDMATFTSSGTGTWGPPLRLGTKAEIVCVQF